MTAPVDGIGSLVAEANRPPKLGRPSRADLARSVAPTAVASTRDERLEALRIARDTAFDVLSPLEARFASEYARLGSARAALRAASPDISDKSLVSIAPRLRQKAEVMRAVRAEVALRDGLSSTSFEQACELLEAALHVRASDLLTYSPDGEAVTGVKAREALSPAQELRIVSLDCKIHSSAKGNRAATRRVRVELTSALDVIRELARLRGWNADAPELRIHLQAATARDPRADAARAIVHELAAKLLEPGDELDRYLVASMEGREEDAAEILKSAADRAAQRRDSIDVTATPVADEGAK